MTKVKLRVPIWFVTEYETEKRGKEAEAEAITNCDTSENWQPEDEIYETGLGSFDLKSVEVVEVKNTFKCALCRKEYDDTEAHEIALPVSPATINVCDQCFERDQNIDIQLPLYIGKTARCLNCGNNVPHQPQKDELGIYTTCPVCGSTFDIQEEKE